MLWKKRNILYEDAAVVVYEKDEEPMTADELRDARKRLGLTQGELARALRIKSDRTIRRMEANELPVGGTISVAVELMLTLKELTCVPGNEE